jgi:tRNA (Thr-GGU) A37 N-methylase
LEQEKKNRHDERLGRISAEKKMAEVLFFVMCRYILFGSDPWQLHHHPQLLQERHPAGVGTLLPIGTIRSVFKDRRGAPRQGCLVPGALARLELSPGVQARDSLQGLGSFSHLWLIFVFHQNTNTATLLVCFRWHLSAAPLIPLPLQLFWYALLKHQETASQASAAGSIEQGLPAWCAATVPDHFPGVKWKIAPPRLGGKKVGVFATRSPHRPNPIGLTLASIVAIEEQPPCIVLSGVDLLDGTPVLDIKPYIPNYDSVPAGSTRIPDWIANQEASYEHVWFSEDCVASVEALTSELRVFANTHALYTSIQQVCCEEKNHSFLDRFFLWIILIRHYMHMTTEL